MKKNKITGKFIKRPDKHLEEIEKQGLDKWEFWTVGFENGRNGDWYGPVSPPLRSDLIQPPPSLYPNTLDIIRLFCFCHENNIYPPGWIMDDLYNRFSSYMFDNLNGKHDAGLGKYFDEKNRRGKFRKLAIKSLTERAIWFCESLHNWFRTPKTKALSICGAWYEEQQKGESAPWRNDKKTRGESVLKKEYENIFKPILSLNKNHNPSDSTRLETLEQIGEQFLAEDPHLIDELKRLIKLKRLREMETKK